MSNFVQYIGKHLHAKDDQYRVNLLKKSIAIPERTYEKFFKGFSQMNFYLDIESKMIKFENIEKPDGWKISKSGRTGARTISISLASKIPKGFYIWKEDLVFELEK